MAFVEKTYQFEITQVVIRYDADKPYSESETKLEASLLAFVKEADDLRTLIVQKQSEFQPAWQEMINLQSLLKLQKELSKDARSSADEYWECINDGTDFNLNELADKVDITSKGFDEYDIKLRVLSDKVDEVIDFVDNYIDLSNDDTLWDALNENEAAINETDKLDKLSIDVEAFISEKERVENIISNYHTLSSGLQQLIENRIKEYKTLILETEMQYELWREFGKRIDMLNKVMRVEVKPLKTDNLNLN